MMGTRLRVHSRIAGSAVCAALLAIAFPANGQAIKAAAHYSATTAGLTPESGVAIKIDVLKWSTDEDAAKLTESFKADPGKWGDALQAAPSIGYVWAGTSSLGYSIKFARQIPLPDGGNRVVLAIDRPLGSFERPAWKATGTASTEYPFSIIELRVNRRGIGDGKASLAGKVAVDNDVKGPALESYATAPIILTKVVLNAAPPAMTSAAPQSKAPTPAPQAR